MTVSPQKPDRAPGAADGEHGAECHLAALATTVARAVTAADGGGAEDALSRIGSLTVAIPPGWGPRRRQVLRDGCRRVGLPAPCLVMDAAAVASWYAASGRLGAAEYLLVVTGGGQPTLTALVVTADGFDALAFQESSTSAEPGAVRQAVEEVLAHAEIGREALGAVLVVGSDLDTLVTPMAEATGCPITQVDARSAALGTLGVATAVGAGSAGGSSPGEVVDPAEADGGPAPQPSPEEVIQMIASVVRPRPGFAIATVLTAVGSLAVLRVSLSGANVYQDYLAHSSYLPGGFSGFATAALLMVLACSSVAYLAATAAPGMPGRQSRSLLRQTYAASACVGLLVAGLYGMFATAALDLQGTPMMRWVLLTPLPVAVASAITGLAAARISPARLAWWVASVHPSQTPYLLVVVGSLLVEWRLWFSQPQWMSSWMFPVLGWIGAGALGVAIGWTASWGNRVLRAVLVVVLGFGAPVVLTVQAPTVFLVVYAIAVSVEWTRIALRTLAIAYPGAGGWNRVRAAIASRFRASPPADRP